MWLLIVEILIVLALAVFIVWWTMSGRRKNHSHPDDRHAGGTADGPSGPGETTGAAAKETPPSDRG